jgi:peptidoglycan L-alanyl-D-glutamate endopeptidase CwlK
MDKITIDRIELMHPIIRLELKKEYEFINSQLPKNVRLRFAYTLRTVKEQEDLYAMGRTKAGRIVTNAKCGQSIHNYGLAFDVVLLYDEDNNGTFEKASWDFDKNMKAVVNYFKSQGWEWGGDWKKFKDAPHFQLKKDDGSSYNWRELINATKDVNNYPIL